MADKDFKTIEEQVEILRSRGLTINDESLAKDFCSAITTTGSAVIR